MNSRTSRRPYEAGGIRYRSIFLSNWSWCSVPRSYSRKNEISRPPPDMRPMPSGMTSGPPTSSAYHSEAARRSRPRARRSPWFSAARPTTSCRTLAPRSGGGRRQDVERGHEVRRVAESRRPPPFDQKLGSSRNSRIRSSSTQCVIQRSDQLGRRHALEPDSGPILENREAKSALTSPVKSLFQFESLNLGPHQIVGSEPVPNPYAFLRLIDANASVSEHAHKAKEKASCNQDRSEPGWSSRRRQGDHHESCEYDHTEGDGCYDLKTIPVYDAHVPDLMTDRSSKGVPRYCSWYLRVTNDARYPRAPARARTSGACA